MWAYVTWVIPNQLCRVPGIAYRKERCRHRARFALLIICIFSDVSNREIFVINLEKNENLRLKHSIMSHMWHMHKLFPFRFHLVAFKHCANFLHNYVILFNLHGESLVGTMRPVLQRWELSETWDVKKGTQRGRTGIQTQDYLPQGSVLNYSAAWSASPLSHLPPTHPIPPPSTWKPPGNLVSSEEDVVRIYNAILLSH